MISVILSGGAGTRLWPVSRTQSPKPFSPIFDSTLFAQTADRLGALGKVWVCTSEAFRSLTMTEIRQAQLPVEKTLFEPSGRNTAPAVGLCCREMERLGLENEVIGIFPADHHITNPAEFTRAVTEAQDWARRGSIVTLGVVPSYPATGFGYIQVEKATGASLQSNGALSDAVFPSGARGGSLSDGTTTGELLLDHSKARAVLSFREKPSRALAEEYFQSGEYFWNSGIFIFQVSAMIEAFKKWMPETWSVLAQYSGDSDSLKDIYGRLQSESLDYGIMENASNQVCIPCDMGWSDLGAWDDIAHFKSDEGPPLYTVDSEGAFAFSLTERTVAIAGVDDIGVVDTDDAVLIYKKGQSQKVKALVEKVGAKDQQLLKEHTWDRRPWGTYRSLYESKECKVKVIEVLPGQQLSYQSHSKRSEVWVVVRGRGQVVLDDQSRELAPGSIVEIPVEMKHRMSNPYDETLKFIEVQQGDYFGEDDIVRYEDDYSRT